MSGAVQTLGTETGSCLCGACRFTATPTVGAGVCHCSMCRKFSGGMFIVTDVGDSLAFADDAPLGVYGSSEWGERLFCKDCGSSLVWRSRDGKMAYASIQAFDDPGRFRLETQLFIDCKPGSYTLANETHTMTEAEFLAHYAATGEGGH